MGNRFPGFQGVTRAQEVERGLGSVYPKGETLVSFLSLTTDNAALSVVGGLYFEESCDDGCLDVLAFIRHLASKACQGPLLGRGEKETLLGELWELPYDLAREPWRKARWR